MSKEKKELSTREILMKIASIENLEKNLSSDQLKRDKLNESIKKRSKQLEKLITEVQDTEAYKKLKG
jgi:hypothetical protein